MNETLRIATRVSALGKLIVLRPRSERRIAKDVIVVAPVRLSRQSRNLACSAASIYWQAGVLPLRVAVLKPPRLETPVPKGPYGLIGKHAVRAAAVSDDLGCGNELLEPSA